MNDNLYEQYKGDLHALLTENCCVVYHIKKDQYLTELRPPSIGIDMEHLSDKERHQLAVAFSFNDGPVPLFSEWDDEPEKAFRIHSVYSLISILNSLFWENQFDHCMFLLVDEENNILDFNSILTREMDIEFITKVFDEYFEEY